MSEKPCPKCDGRGRVPQWPKPACVLPVNVIRAIRENAPDCGECKGTGRVEER